MAKAQLRQYIFSPTLGTIEIPGKWDLQQLLVITNTTKNAILYNFADVTYSGTTISFARAADTYFPTALDNTDGITTITLAVGVSLVGMSATDSIQIFVENPEQTTRPWPMGTDAFERQRVAAPQSLLDADFEYGMQPTKWLTISQMRGYPAIYEIPGTDQAVTNATTDASSLSGGTSINESLITITTAAAHGFTVGQAITIKGFNSAITGYDRAEGSFIIYTVPTTTTFTYFAKGKVGFNNGDSIFTAFVQLRTGGFYTGASINAVISLTATGTNVGTGSVTVNTTTGLTVGTAITFSTIVTNAVGTTVNGATSTVTLGTTTGMIAGMPIYFSGVSFSGIATGTTYYVKTVVDTRNLIMCIDSGLTTVFVPTSTAINGNMNVTGGASFGGITSGTTYYVTGVLSGTSITVSTNVIYTTTITSTDGPRNCIRLAGYTFQGQAVVGTYNLVVGEPIVVSGTPFGNLTATTYYVSQILDSYNVIISATLGGAPFVQSTASGTMTAAVGVNTPVTGVSGYLWGVSAGLPTFTFSTPATVATFTGSISGNSLSVVSVSQGTLVVGLGLTGTGVPSGTVITALNGGTGGAGGYTISTSTGTASSATITAVATVATITVNTYSPHGLVPGHTINVLCTSDNGSNNNQLLTGPFFVEQVLTANTFTYTARGVGLITGAITAALYPRPDSFYSHRPFDGGVQLGTGLPTYDAQAIRMSKKYMRYQSGKAINFNTGFLMAPNFFVRSLLATNTSYVTGLSITNITTGGVATITSGTYVVGQAIIVTGTITTTTGFTAGTYYVMTVTNSTTITLSASLANQVINVPIALGSSGAVTGAVVTAAPVITVTTDDVDHGCQLGAGVNVSGSATSGYNGNYIVVGILDERTLQVIANGTLNAGQASLSAQISDPCLLNITSWYGATVRSGTFDEQNGVFFQFDGQTISCVKRASTFQLAGTITVVVGSGQIIGLNTRFTSQLYAGDRIVIRGMSHVVTQVTSDTLMYVNPQYRGYANVSGIKITKTIDRVIPQNQWNLDRFDGSNGPYNPSGYNCIVYKMQMVGMQWTWYGAGSIDWMMRGPKGDYTFVHRLRNNNLNNEGWMRTGNMPVRYEVQNSSAKSYISGNITVGVNDTTIPINDATFFPTPTSGNTCSIYIDNEVITYSGKISTQATLSGVTGITVSSTTNMYVGMPIVFTNPLSYTFGNINNNTTYYIFSITGNILQLSTTLPTTAGGSGTVMTQAVYTPANSTFYMNINALTGCLRTQPIVPWATGGYRTFLGGPVATHTAGTGVLLILPSASPIVSHWGSAFIEDGGFDADRSYIFNYSQPNVNISTKKTTAFAVRLSPSVSNALPGDLGARELINRASFLLQTLESCAGNTSNANTAIVIEGILNPSNYPALTNIQWNTLSSATNPTGQPSFSQVAPGTSMVFANSVTNSTTITNSPAAAATTFTVNSTTGIQVGDDVFFPNSTAALQGLTKVSAINSNTITVNLPILVGQTSSAIVQFSRGTYALPGETVFSYVNSPANKDSLDLTPFKELTNTPIGGRGTYPNGCDALFINAYITQGSPLNQNLILRWGEAQA